MVAVIHSGSSLRNILNYNEQKVNTGSAICLEASGYPKETDELTFYQKLSMLEKLTELNQATRVNSVHISLNFDPSERFMEDRLKQIAAAYMDGIGFGGQPYLLYQHFDAGHPHVHLLTTNIQADGKRISLHNLGRNQSEITRKKVEVDFHLVRAEHSSQLENYRLKPVDARKVLYGRVESKRAMANVISTVVKNYNYSSLAELNAILQLYNVLAERGSENSRIYQHQGLVYRILNDQKMPVGVPVKASDFHFKPTLKYLSERFALHMDAKAKHKSRLKNAIDLVLLKADLTLPAFVVALQQDGIDTIIRKNEDGLVYGMTYVDHRSKCVFNGSALGKAYSAKGILERCVACIADKKIKVSMLVKPLERQQPGHPFKGVDEGVIPAPSGQERLSLSASLPDTLLQPDEHEGQMDWQLKRTKKKKRRRQIASRQ